MEKLYDMKELLENIAKYLVDDPGAVEVNEAETDKGVSLSLSVAPDDMGKVIGKKGCIARAIRTVIKAAAIHNDVRVNVEIGK